MISRGRLPVVVLISGSGSNLQALIDQAPDIGVEIVAVFSDRDDAFGLQRARTAGIPAHFVDPGQFAGRDEFDRGLAQEIDRYAPGLVVLAGFMRILTPFFVDHYKDRMMNIHPSLLPRYRGLHTHRRVLEAGDRDHGCSVHFVIDELDGGPLISQARIDILPEDDQTTLSARVQAKEHKLYPLTVGWFASGRLRVRDNQVWLDNEPLLTPVVYSGNEEIE